MPPPRKPVILVCPTAYKGTLSPMEAARVIARAVRKMRPGSHVLLQPVADGGDGTLEVLLQTFSGKKLFKKVTGPMGLPVLAAWGLLRNVGSFPGRTAVIEMAEASGLKLVRGKKRIRDATSVGTGELISEALNRGCRTILLGVGGTASSDGGAGALEALGLRYYDAEGVRLSSRPRELVRLKRIDFRALDPRLKKTRLIILCDVKNPLLGDSGSARTFGPQKGATPRDVVFLERFFRRWSTFAPKKKARSPGAGAAGGIAFGLSAFAGARLTPGFTMIRKVINWSHVARLANLIITGEGRLDPTSFSGKAVGGLIRHRFGKQVYAVCGSTNLTPKQQRHVGISRLEVMGPSGLKNSRKALYEATLNLLS